MADTSNILKFPLVRANQTQKEVSVNEALIALEAVTQLVVLDIRSSPPTSVNVGDRYIVGNAPSGDWVSYSQNAVVVAIEGGWRSFTPVEGWEAYVAAAGRRQRYVGGSWVDRDITDGRLDLALSAAGQTVSASDMRKVRFLSIAMTASGTVTIPNGVTGVRHIKATGAGFTATIGGVAVAGGSSAVVWLKGDGTAEAI